MKWMPCVVAFCVGALSLMQEVLWTRVVSFMTHGVPEGFAAVLVLYLVGIAVGAQVGKWACVRSQSIVALSGVALGLAAVMAATAPGVSLRAHSLGFPMLGVAPVIVVTAGLYSFLFPVVHHLGASDISDRQGVSFSGVYFSNVIGCAIGPLLIGFLVLDYLALDSAFMLVGALTLSLAIYVFLHTSRAISASLVSILGFSAALMIVSPGSYIEGMAGGKPGDGEVNNVIETKEGVIHTQAAEGGDMVFGGNVYDGRINVDLRVDSNGIGRVYALAASHGSPEAVLVVGLSSGSWVEVLSTFPSVQQIDAVEINPGYLELIERYPEVSSILQDDRVSIHVDDGRRWLRKNAGRKFDLIALNTTFHWRANSTNMLSREFMVELQGSLAPGGLVLVNATGSPDVFNTIADVFPFAFLYRNVVFASDHDFRAGLTSNIDVLYETTRAGVPVFSRDDSLDVRAVSSLLAVPFVGLDEVKGKVPRPLEVITDDNMLTEYKYGRGLF